MVRLDSATPLDEASLAADPLVQFSSWFETAKAASGMKDPNACCLSTVTPEGFPDGRMVLLRQFDAKGFVFYTNIESEKGRALAKLPAAALTFFWDALSRQIRVRGSVEPVPEEEADRYFSQRNRLSQIGAWASQQSRVLPSRKFFEERIQHFEKRFDGQAVPRPPHWSGYRIAPVRIEFWQEREHRLHDRFVYRLEESGAWSIERLFP